MVDADHPSKVPTFGINYLQLFLGVFFLVELLYIAIITLTICIYKVLHTRTNWVLFNWFLTAIICLGFNSLTFFAPSPLINPFLHHYCHITVDLVVGNIYFMLMLSFDDIFDKLSEKTFKMIVISIWATVLSQYCFFEVLINTRYLLVIVCQIPISLIVIKYLLAICGMHPKKAISVAKRVRFAAVGNFTLAYLGGLLAHTVYFNGQLPNDSNFFQIFHYNVVVVCPIFVSFFLLGLDKNFRKCCWNSIRCGKDPIVALELSDIALTQSLHESNSNLMY